MIHLTVASPLGIDSIFFSFIERLALHNGHLCVDPPAQQLDVQNPGDWINGMRSSSQHHFVIGYRYPPSYWKLLAESASTICLLADPDGIVRQVDQLQHGLANPEDPSSIAQSVDAIRHALSNAIDLAEYIICSRLSLTRILPPATAFLEHTTLAFKRLEHFYRKAGVTITIPCWEAFTEEAYPLLVQIKPPNDSINQEIRRLLTLEESTPYRLEAVAALFGSLYNRTNLPTGDSVVLNND